MFDSLEMRVLYPTRWISEAQGYHRKMGSERSVEQKREPIGQEPVGGVGVGRAGN
jgi:hypothetical protein